MLIDFKIRALFIWTDPYLPDLVHSIDWNVNVISAGVAAKSSPI